MEVQLRTSRAEVKQLVIAWFALTLGFTLLMSPPLQMEIERINFETIAVTFFISLVTAGAGFLLHELAHKVTAQRYGYWAEFRADYEMLGLTIASGALGFLFAAPGAVEIRGQRIGERANGVIAVAGPFVNILLFGVFVPFTFVVSEDSILWFVATFGAFINAFLAAFNMIPYGPLDGRKILEWDERVFGVFLAVSFALAGYMLFS